MPRLLLPLALSAVSFAIAWWAGTIAHPPAAGSAGIPVAGPVSSAPTAGDELSVWGFARCEARLRRESDHGIGNIRQCLESGDFDPAQVHALATAWAAQDAAGLWNWLERGGREKLIRGHDLTSLVFRAWGKQDLTAAMAALRGLGHSYRNIAAGGVLSLLNESDETLKNRLASFLDDLVNPGGSWPMPSPDMAVNAAILLKLPTGIGRDSLLRTVAGQWMHSGDWRAASAWAMGLPEPLKTKMMETVVSWSLEPNYREYDNHGNEIISDNSRERRDQAWKWFLEEAPPELRRKMGGEYVQSLARTDPAAALEWAQKNLAARSLASAVAEVLTTRAAQDPAAARAVVEELPPGPLRQRAAFAVVETGTPTQETVNWLVGKSDKAFHSGWAKVAVNWTAADPEAWRRYIQDQGAERLPWNFVRAGLSELSSKDGPGTLDWALATQSMETTGMALGDWSRKDVAAAAAWLKDHAATEWSPEISAEVSGYYFRRSPAEAVDWAAGLPDGPVRESVTAALRKSLAASAVLKPEERTRLESRLAGP